MAALPQAVVALTAPDGSVGTGFFVAPGLVLTCAHVVRAGDRVGARCGGLDLELFADPRWYHPKGPDGEGPDLALLQAPEGLDHPVVCLAAEVVPGDELWSFGHPQGSYRAGESVSFRAEGPSLRSAGGAAVSLHHVTQGRAGPGFSGGPVLNWRTGGVCGVLRLAYGLLGGAAGARLVTVEDVCAAYPFLEPPEAVTRYRRPWLDLLDDAQIRQGGWRYAGPVLRDYLRAARAAADDHPYAIRLPGTSPPPLTDVYVSQQISAHGDSQDRVVSADAVLDAGGGAVVIGGPGAGKSSLGRHLTTRLAGQWLGGGDAPDVVPVRVSASALTGQGSVADRLAAAVRRDARFLPQGSLPEGFFATCPLADTPWLVMVDGVDEVLDPGQRKALLAMVADLSCQPDGAHRVLVLTRPLPQDELKPLRDVAFYRIEPFDPHALSQFVAGWFAQLGRPDPAGRAERFLAALAQRQIAELSRIPLLATMLVLLFDEDPERGLPHSRSELYERFVQHLLNVMYRRPEPSLVQLQRRVEGWGSDARTAVDQLMADARGLLEMIALERHTGSKSDAIDLAETHTAGLRPRHLDGGEWRGVLREVLATSGLMTESDDDLVFLHHTVQEFLAACGLAGTAAPDSQRARGAVADALAEIDENGTWLQGTPVDHSFLRFVFAAWARQGTDAGDLVQALFNPPWKVPPEEGTDLFEQRWDRGVRLVFRVLRSLRLVGPGGGAGLVALMMAEGDVLPEGVQPYVVATLRRAALRSGRSWAAEAIAAQDRALGVRLLTEMVCSRHLPPHRRWEAARALARWDKEAAVSLLTETVLRGPALPRGAVRWRETNGNEARIYPVRADTLTGVGIRVAAAKVLATLEPAKALRALETVAEDAAQPDWHRLRIARALAGLDSAAGVLRAPEPAVGLTAERALSPELVLALAGPRHPAAPVSRRLTTWARDATAAPEERIAAALALTLANPEQGSKILAWLVRAPEFVSDADTSADEVQEVTFGFIGEWRWPWSRRMPLLWDEDVAVAARHLAELDSDLAVEALQHRLDSGWDWSSHRTLETLARIAPKAAAERLKRRLTPSSWSGFGSRTALTDALAYGPEVAAASLALIMRDKFIRKDQRIEAARLLAVTDPARAVNELVRLLRSGSHDFHTVDLARAMAQVEPQRVAQALRTAADPRSLLFLDLGLKALLRELETSAHA